MISLKLSKLNSVFWRGLLVGLRWTIMTLERGLGSGTDKGKFTQINTFQLLQDVVQHKDLKLARLYTYISGC